MRGDVVKRIFLLLGLVGIVVITGFLMTGPEISLKENPSMSKSYDGYYVFFRTLDLLHVPLNHGLDKPKSKKNLAILAELVSKPGIEPDEEIKKILDSLDAGAVVLLDHPWLFDKIPGLELGVDRAEFTHLPEDAKVLFNDGELDYFVKIPYKNASEKSLTLLYPSDGYYLQNEYFAEMARAPELAKALEDEFGTGPLDILELPIDTKNPAGKDLTKGIPDLWIVLAHLVVFGLVYFAFAGRRFGPIRRKRPKRDMGLYEHLEASGSYLKETRPWRYAEELDNAWFKKELRKFPESQGRQDIEDLFNDQNMSKESIKGRIKKRLKILQDLKEGRTL